MVAEQKKEMNETFIKEEVAKSAGVSSDNVHVICFDTREVCYSYTPPPSSRRLQGSPTASPTNFIQAFSECSCVGGYAGFEGGNTNFLGNSLTHERFVGYTINGTVFCESDANECSPPLGIKAAYCDANSYLCLRRCSCARYDFTTENEPIYCQNVDSKICYPTDDETFTTNALDTIPIGRYCQYTDEYICDNSPTASPTTSPTVSPSASPTWEEGYIFLFNVSVSKMRYEMEQGVKNITTQKMTEELVSNLKNDTIVDNIKDEYAQVINFADITTSISAALVTRAPTSSPTASPSTSPSMGPTASPSTSPSMGPTASPSASPSMSGSYEVFTGGGCIGFIKRSGENAFKLNHEFARQYSNLVNIESLESVCNADPNCVAFAHFGHTDCISHCSLLYTTTDCNDDAIGHFDCNNALWQEKPYLISGAGVFDASVGGKYRQENTYTCHKKITPESSGVPTYYAAKSAGLCVDQNNRTGSYRETTAYLHGWGGYSAPSITKHLCDANPNCVAYSVNAFAGVWYISSIAGTFLNGKKEYYDLHHDPNLEWYNKKVAQYQEWQDDRYLISNGFYETGGSHMVFNPEESASQCSNDNNEAYTKCCNTDGTFGGCTEYFAETYSVAAKICEEKGQRLCPSSQIDKVPRCITTYPERSWTSTPCDNTHPNQDPDNLPHEYYRDMKCWVKDVIPDEIITDTAQYRIGILPRNGTCGEGYHKETYQVGYEYSVLPPNIEYCFPDKCVCTNGVAATIIPIGTLEGAQNCEDASLSTPTLEECQLTSSGERIEIFESRYVPYGCVKIIDEVWWKIGEVVYNPQNNPWKCNDNIGIVAWSCLCKEEIYGISDSQYCPSHGQELCTSCNVGYVLNDAKGTCDEISPTSAPTTKSPTSSPTSSPTKPSASPTTASPTAKGEGMEEFSIAFAGCCEPEDGGEYQVVKLPDTTYKRCWQACYLADTCQAFDWRWWLFNHDATIDRQMVDNVDHTVRRGGFCYHYYKTDIHNDYNAAPEEVGCTNNGVPSYAAYPCACPSSQKNPYLIRYGGDGRWTPWFVAQTLNKWNDEDQELTKCQNSVFTHWSATGDPAPNAAKACQCVPTKSIVLGNFRNNCGGNEANYGKFSDQGRICVPRNPRKIKWDGAIRTHHTSGSNEGNVKDGGVYLNLNDGQYKDNWLATKATLDDYYCPINVPFLMEYENTNQWYCYEAVQPYPNDKKPDYNKNLCNVCHTNEATCETAGAIFVDIDAPNNGQYGYNGGFNYCSYNGPNA